jgi:hypothetical protein
MNTLPRAELEEQSNVDVHYDKIRMSPPKKYMFDNFAACQVRTHSVIHQIRILDECELDNVCNVCGN